MKPDVLDIAGLTGLGLMAWGLYEIWPPLAPLITGIVILAGVCWLATQSGGRNGTDNKPG